MNPCHGTLYLVHCTLYLLTTLIIPLAFINSFALLNFHTFASLKTYNFMKRFIPVLILICAVCISGTPDQAKKILPYPILQSKLDNGLNVVTVPYPSPGLAAFYIVVRAGSRDEIEAGHTGFAHFFEHMMF